MLKGNVKLLHEPEIDPGRAVADAIVEAAKRTDASNKALIDAVKSIMVAAPQVQVVHHETKQVVNQPYVVPKRRVFTVQRGEDGLISSIEAKRLTFTVQRDADGVMTELIVEAK